MFPETFLKRPRCVTGLGTHISPNHLLERGYLAQLYFTHTHTHTASQPSEGGSLEDAAYRCYRKRSGEEALLDRKRKQRRIASSLEVFSRKDVRDSNRIHYQFLARLHQQVGPEPQPLCSNPTCEHKCAPFASRCLKRILFDCVCVCEGGGGGGSSMHVACAFILVKDSLIESGRCRQFTAYAVLYECIKYNAKCYYS